MATIPTQVPMAPRTLALFAATLLACAGPARSPTRAAAPASDKIESEEEYAVALQAYYELDPEAPSRSKQRIALLRYASARILGHGARGGEEGLDRLRDLCFLLDPPELWAPARLGEAERTLLEGAARAVYDVQARVGNMDGTVLALGVLATLDARVWQPRYEQHVGWMQEFDLGGGGEGRVPPLLRLIEAHEHAVHDFPAPLLVERLAQLYRARRGGGDGGIMRLFRGAGELDTARAIARAYLRAGRPEEAHKAIADLRGKPDDDAVLRPLLDRVAAGRAVPDDYTKLAMHLATHPGRRTIDVTRGAVRDIGLEREAALQVCLLGAARFPRDADSAQCAAELIVTTAIGASQVGGGPERPRLPRAIRLLERVVEVAPDRRQPHDLLASMYLDRLSTRIADESSDLGAAERDAERTIAFLETVRKRFPSTPLEVTPSQVWAELARGYYGRGEPQRAVTLLEQSIRATDNADAREQLGIIRLKRGDTQDALRMFAAALELTAGRTLQDLVLRARVKRFEGDAWERMGQSERAASARKLAADAWEQVARMTDAAQPRRERALAEALFERGRALFLIGRAEEAANMFEQAIGVAPMRGETYADIIAFLAPRNELEMAGKVYRSALSRPDRDVSEYLKVYASLWLVDNARRLGQTPEPAAVAYLASVEGNRWYHDLARYASGRLSQRDLEARADTPGKRAEVDFYVGMRRLAEGQTGEARERWKRVVDSKMLGFFEFDMADHFLRFGSGPTARGPSKSI